VVFDVLYSGIEGRMQGGDTFGLWTFGQEVKAGIFPVQTWLPEQSMDLATMVGRFLKEQSNGRKSEVEVALAKAESLAKAVKDVDIVIITSASARFKADDTWEVLQQAWNSRVEEARKNKKAIIIALAARSGRIAQTTVTLQGERLELAAPPERRQPQTMAKKAAAPETAPKVAREPIIMQGTPKPKPIDQIPTKFAPPPAEPPPVEDPFANPAPEPEPVPVLRPANPVVAAPPVIEREGERPREPQAIPVAAREPGNVAPAQSAPPAAVTPRMLIIAGVSLMLIATALGTWILIHIRSRNRASYISRSMTSAPGQAPDDRDQRAA
jgi:hypothetical protein